MSSSPTCFGMAAANFGEPLSLRAWSKQHNVSFVEADTATLTSAVEALGKELHRRIIAAIPVLAVPLLSVTMLSSDTPVDRDDLKKQSLKELAKSISLHGVLQPGRCLRPIP